MKFQSYKGVRIVQNGSRYYCTSPELGTVQITPSNALDIFMSCTSFCGDIQNELFKIGTNGAHTLLYPEHSEFYKEQFQQKVVVVDEFVRKYSELEFGDCVMNTRTQEEMMFLGKFYYLELSQTQWYLRIHNSTAQVPNSARGYFFMSNSGTIYIASAKAEAMKSRISFECTGKLRTDITLMPKQEVHEIIQRKCDNASKFVDMLKNAKIEVVYACTKKFKGDSIKSTKIQQDCTLQELAESNMCSRSRHFIKIGNDWMSIASAFIHTNDLFFGFNGLEVNTNLQKVKPLILQFYRS